MIDVDIRVGRLPEALDDFGPGDFQAVFSDPPYGLGKLGPGRLRAMLNAWLDDREGTQTAGMLGREWDVVIGPPTWQRIRDVTSPGALSLTYSHARTVHLQTLAMQLAGWQILPQWTRIHGGAMALGLDVCRAIDSDADAPLARRFDGYNTAVRAVTEPIVSAVNPPSGPWASNAAEHGCGGFNVGDNRISAGVEYYDGTRGLVGEKPSAAGGVTRGKMHTERRDPYDPRGRFPSNVILEHAAGCGSDWCVEGCPVRTLGEMSGELTTAGNRACVVGQKRVTTGAAGERFLRDRDTERGTAARFYYQGRASREERHRGAEGCVWHQAPGYADGWILEGGEEWRRIRAAGEPLPDGEVFCGNPHLAVKAADGGAHLAGLLRQPGPEARILIPYAGTGSEIIAAMLAGWRRIVAVEMSDQWAAVARRRVAWWRQAIESGSRGEALAILRDWGTSSGEAPAEDEAQLALFGT